MTKPSDLDLVYHQWTVADYHKLAEIGLLSEKRVELLSGEIIYMSPIGKLHAATVKHLAAIFWELIGKNAIVSIQDPITLSDNSEPEPDLAILKWQDRFYADKMPGPEDVLLIVEVADSTLQKDRLVKLPLYAAANIPELWIVNLTDKVLEQYTEPKTDNYSLRRLYQPGDILSHQLLGDLAIADILL